MAKTAIKVKPNRKYILAVAVVFIIAITLYFVKEYNRKPADLTTEKPQETIASSELIKAFKLDEAKANKQFLGKTIMVSGFITEINKGQDTLVNIFLGDSTQIEKISCIMDMRKKNSFANLKTGTQISVIGFCTGFLQDVEMSRCVIVPSK